MTALPNGYDTVVGERGATLSGGQRQRIAIAHATVREAPIVILDEAMSGLDEGTEREVVAALNRLTHGRTTLVITHDLDAARHCDRLVWIQQGRVADQGSTRRGARAPLDRGNRTELRRGGEPWRRPSGPGCGWRAPSSGTRACCCSTR